MVKHINSNAAPELDKLNAQDAAAIINHTLSSTRSQTKDKFLYDELIVSLSDAYENRRARQVNEWERRQRVVRTF